MSAQATTTVQIADIETTATNTVDADRMAELDSCLKGCQLVGATPDLTLVAENQPLTGYRRVDLADNFIVIETDSTPGPIVTEGTDQEEVPRPSGGSWPTASVTDSAAFPSKWGNQCPQSDSN